MKFEFNVFPVHQLEKGLKFLNLKLIKFANKIEVLFMLKGLANQVNKIEDLIKSKLIKSKIFKIMLYGGPTNKIYSLIRSRI